MVLNSITCTLHSTTINRGVIQYMLKPLHDDMGFSLSPITPCFSMVLYSIPVVSPKNLILPRYCYYLYCVL
jgi:hypothetical protein